MRISPFLVAAALFAQAPQEPLVRVTTRLVEINVIARDKSGPVRNLTKDDFTVLEKGKERKIAFFSMNAASQSSQAAPAPLPPNVFTNRPEYRAPVPPNVTIILLDAINTDTADQHFARRQFLKFLTHIKPGDRIAVYALGTQLRILNDFTTDAQRLVAAAAHYAGEAQGLVAASNPQASDSGDSDIDAWLNESNGVIADRAIADRARTTAIAMESIANHLANIPGRKSLIWISGSFPFSIGHFAADGPPNWEEAAFDANTRGAGGKTGSGRGGGAMYGVNLRDGSPAREQMNFAKDVERATRALNDANISVYPVDARGLVAMPKNMTAAGNTPVSKSAAMGPAPSQSLVPVGWAAMQTIAESTGGVVFQNTNDLGGAIRTAIDDSEVTYTLGFYPTNLDSKFHDLKVLVKRGDVELRYRKGYLAGADPKVTEDRRAGQIREALASPLEATALSLTAAVERVEGSLRVSVAVDPKELSIEHKDGKWNGEFEIFISRHSADGRVLGNISQPLGLHLDQAHYDALMQNGFTVAKTIEPQPELAQIRIVLYDRTSGKLGSLIVPVKPAH